MPNPRFIKTAERWKNKKPPSERIQSVTPVQQSPLLINNASYSFLKGTEAQEILKEYNGRVERDYQGASALKVLSFADNVLKGSNPFAFILLNKILAQKKMRIATPADLERALEKEAIDLRNTYGDSGLVLRSENDPNEYLAKDLIVQIKQKGSLQYPLMIPLTGLGLEYNSGSPHNLVFQLTDSTELIHAPQFDNLNDGKRFDKGDERGIPIFDKNGSRTLYTGKGGLRRLCRNWILSLNAGDEDLTYSDGGGRVVVCAEGTSPKKQ